MASFIPSLPPLNIPSFPSVPPLPGVPPLPRLPSVLSLPEFSGKGGLPEVLSAILIAQNTRNGVIQYDDPTLPEPIPAAVWGLLDNSAEPVLEVDSVLSIEYLNDSRVPDYPLEKGSFAAYNKVSQPYLIRVSLAKGGSVDDRSEFINKIEQIRESLDLYVLSTPEKAYLNGNVTSISWRREQRNGANLIIIDAHIQEIRESGTATFTQTKEPSGSQTQKAGYIQPRPAPATAPNSATIR